MLEKYEKYNHKFIKEDSDMLPEEFIINKLQINKHIHGDVKHLEDIKKSITKDSYNYKHNSNDKNGKKIICGDKKCFYDWRTNRLSIGYAWHNINNMWWVIVNNKKYNIASFNLFDFDSNLPRRKDFDARELESILNRHLKKNEYLKCHHIKNRINEYNNRA